MRRWLLGLAGDEIARQVRARTEQDRRGMRRGVQPELLVCGVRLRQPEQHEIDVRRDQMLGVDRGRVGRHEEHR